MAHLRHTEPHISDIEKQIRWELGGVERGAARVRETMAEQRVADSDLGTKIMHRLAPALIRGIEEAQEEAAKAVDGKGRPQLWWWLILCLPADQLAVITLKAIFNEKPRDFTFKLPITSAASLINQYVYGQLDYEMWKQEQEAKPDEENQHLQFLRFTKQIDARRFKRFSEKVGRQKHERWSKTTGIAFGVKLIQLLTTSAPDWFEVKMGRLRGGRTEQQLVFSELAMNAIADLAEHCELSRPTLLPMICPPAPWRRTQ